jgi:hypothetical protein
LYLNPPVKNAFSPHIYCLSSYKNNSKSSEVFDATS